MNATQLKQKEEREERLQIAAKAVSDRTMTYDEAAQCYDLPKSSICDRIKGKYKSNVVGAPRKMSSMTEMAIVEILQFSSDIGFGLNRYDVLSIVENYLKESKQTELFENNKPSKKWYKGFMKKYADQIRTRKASSMQSIRATASQPKLIDNWFRQVTEAYANNDLERKPLHIFNCDESGLQLDQGKVEIICRKGVKRPKKLGPSNEKKMTTILTCCDAAGNYLPHQIIYKGKYLMQDWCKGGAKNVYYNTSESGWMEAEQFIEWFKTVFLSHANKLEGTKLLFLDGHASHISLELKKLAIANNIILWRLPAHTSHFLQPLDVGVFKTIKAEWKKIVELYLIRNKFKSLTNKQFPAMFKDLIEKKGFKEQNARSGFRSTGLFPLDRSKITDEHTAIGAIYQAVENDEIESLFIEEPSRTVLGNISNTPKTPKTPHSRKQPCREDVLKMFEEASRDLKTDMRKSMLTQVKTHLTPLSNREKSERIKRTANYNMTEAESKAIEEAEQAAKKKKLEELAANKLAREQKKILNASQKAENAQKREEKKIQKQSQPAKTVSKRGRKPKNIPVDQSQALDSQALDLERICFNCGSHWLNSSDNQWIACERCPNWSCVSCVDGYYPTMEFIWDVHV